MATEVTADWDLNEEKKAALVKPKRAWSLKWETGWPSGGQSMRVTVTKSVWLGQG
jgi:hypothetical protein